MYKKLLLVFMSIFVLLCMSACGAGISLDDGKKYTEDFWIALSEKDYEAAASLMHPISEASADDIEDFADGMEYDFGVDFDFDDVSVTNYTGFETMIYDSDVGGARLTLSFQINIGGMEYSGSSELVRNSDGFGISGISIDYEQSNALTYEACIPSMSRVLPAACTK